MLLKTGVDIYHLHRSIRRILPKIDSLFPDFVITSTRHDSHGPGSLHYAGQAIDIRETHLGNVRIQVGALKALLGKDFDVVYHNNHFHIEYDPKEG